MVTTAYLFAWKRSCYVKITLLKVKWNLFIGLSYSALRNYLEGMRQNKSFSDKHGVEC